MKTHDEVKFLQENFPERTQLAKSTVQNKDMNVFHAEVWHFSEVITQALVSYAALPQWYVQPL